MSENDMRMVFERLDSLSREMGEVKSLISAKNTECNQQDEMITELRHRITDVEQKSVLFSGGVNFVAWLITAGIALCGVMK